ncbi:type 1 glutamine amidotransferase [Acaricomes phytoseiuli]|uniref:type 1 glutamine amidotransferase domain-containing protein n=1 Tax=Acaricomes phytoseiuli TaxID=291968 RepID=UPI000381BED8|nr:type 1 glutamine amidotransferase domain-containing protein [Acaricomes phytoseiuli]MCW1249934.1 type 1 glutamine amidotransferase [Acaricomes phytoseiuli]
MTDHNLSGKKIAFVLTDGVEEPELTSPWKAVQEAGASPVLISPAEGDSIQAYNGDVNEGGQYPVDLAVSAADPADYDALVLPGGLLNSDQIRLDQPTVAFVKAFFDAGKPVAAICHAPWILIEADVVKDRKLTSYPSLETDLRNAGALWEDREVVVDHGLVTSRTPDDLEAFNAKLVEEVAEGKHQGQKPENH